MEPLPPLGLRVMIGVTGAWGTVRFAGPTRFSDGNWIGLEMDEAIGKNDGSVKGVRYFDCSTKKGVFVRASALRTEADGEVDPAREPLGDKVVSSWRAPPTSLSPPPNRQAPRVASSSRTGLTPEQKQLRRELLQAVEDRSVDSINLLMPKAMSLKLSSGDIAAAQAVLSYELHCSWSAEVAKMKSSLAAAVESISSVQATDKADAAASLVALREGLDANLERAVRAAVDAASAEIRETVSQLLGERPLKRSSAPKAASGTVPAAAADGPDAEDKDLVAAATKIQAIRRGNLSRKQKEASSEAKEPANDADSTTQATAQVSIAPPTTANTVASEDAELIAAATKIQAIHRGNLSRQQVEKSSTPEDPPQEEVITAASAVVSEDAELAAAATKIQAIHRGNLSRQQGQQVEKGSIPPDPPQDEATSTSATALSEDKDLVAAATKIQAIHRGNLSRKEQEAAAPPVSASSTVPMGSNNTTAKEAKRPEERGSCSQYAGSYVNSLLGRALQQQEAVHSDESEPDDVQLAAAATKIQAIHRGNLARKEAAVGVDVAQNNGDGEALGTPERPKRDSGSRHAGTYVSSLLGRALQRQVEAEDASKQADTVQVRTSVVDLTGEKPTLKAATGVDQKDPSVDVVLARASVADLTSEVTSQQAPLATAKEKRPSSSQKAHEDDMQRRSVVLVRASVADFTPDTAQEASGTPSTAAASGAPSELDDKELVAAATKIQAIRRGNLSRKQREEALATEASATPSVADNIPPSARDEATSGALPEPGKRDSGSQHASSYVTSLMGRALQRQDESGTATHSRAEPSPAVTAVEASANKRGSGSEYAGSYVTSLLGRALQRQEEPASREMPKVPAEADDAELHAAATKIQAIHRGNVARQQQAENSAAAADQDASPEAPPASEDKDLIAAATKIQAIHRGNLSRKQQEEAPVAATSSSSGAAISSAAAPAPQQVRIASVPPSKEAPSQTERRSSTTRHAGTYVSHLMGRALRQQEGSGTQSATDADIATSAPAAAAASEASIQQKRGSAVQAESYVNSLLGRALRQ